MKSYFSISHRPASNRASLTYDESLRLDLELAKWEMENAYAGFDYATDPDMIDYYIYKLNASMKRYKYLLDKYSTMKKEVFIPDNGEPSGIVPMQEGALQLL